MEDLENNVATEENTEETENFEATDVKEPDVSDNSQSEEQKPEESEQSEQLILGKFKSNDDLATAYTENEKQLGKMSNELGELRKVKEEYDKIIQEREELAKAYKYNSAEEMQQAAQQIRVDQDMANFIADEYAKHINEVDFPDEMRNLLMNYRNNPTDEMLKIIEDEFSKGTIKEVAAQKTMRQGQLDYERYQARLKQEEEAVNQYLTDVTTKYDDDRYFKNDAFRNLYAVLFKSFGLGLETDKVIDLLEPYAQARIELAQKQKASQSENAQATDAIEGLSGGANDETSSKSVLDMTEEELQKALRTTYKKK